MGTIAEPSIVLRPLVEALVSGLQQRLWAVVLFGSAARQEATETSDLDLLVVADDVPPAFTARVRLVRGLVPDSLKGKVSLIVKTRAEIEGGFPLYYLDLGLDGVVLYDRGRYMEEKLETIRGLITRAGLRRERIDHGFVWKWLALPPGHWRIDWSGVHGRQARCALSAPPHRWLPRGGRGGSGPPPLALVR